MKPWMILISVAVACIAAMQAPGQGAGRPCSVLVTANCVSASGAGDGFQASAGARPNGRKAPTGVRGAATSHAGAVSQQPPRSFDEFRHVPTCTGNDLGGPDALCNAATQTCASAGDIRFWVYSREVDRKTGAASAWTRVQNPPFVCAGPDDPAVVVDPRIAIAAIVQRDFQRVVVLKGAAEVSPRPDTLVNIPTRFTTDAPHSYDIPLTLLGQRVTITATARRWIWHFGDGTSATTTAAGTKGLVEHVYRRSTSVGAYVIIEWSGTYRIGAGPTMPITGTATTVGDPTSVAVRQARTELVDRSS